MENLIPLINKLQDAFASIGLAGIDLPQIAVVGSQSSGKSSVLESIVGKDFLPRGSGIVTRRPLVLQLIHSEKEEYGVFLHNSSKKFYDFHQIRNEIQAETDRQTGVNKGISSVPINLKIYSPNVLNLTMIDLPGVTKVAIGDQPPDIEIQIRDMVMEYIEKASCLILAVSPANSANSDALQLSRFVDPEGNRTIGVLTKLDLMDEGTHALDILTNKLLPLKHGYVGVVNRSQKDIDSNKDVKSAIQKEQDWFTNHPVYAPINATCGTKYLQEKLKKTLVQHIAHHLPDLKHRLHTRLNALEKELNSLNAPFQNLNTGNGTVMMAGDVLSDENQMRTVMLNIIRSFTFTIKSLIDGHDGDVTDDAFQLMSFVSGSVTTSSTADGEEIRGLTPNHIELNNAVRIKFIFQDVFPDTLKTIENYLMSSCMDDEIRAIIHNARGLRAGLFVPDALFELLIKRFILQMESPSMDCVDAVYDELLKMLRAVLAGPGSPVRSFPRLLDWMMNESVEMLDRFKKPTMEEVKRLIQMEICYINTGHPDFIGRDGVGKWLAVEKRKRREKHHRSPISPLGKRSSGLILGHKEGNLWKLGGTRKNWKRRYFVVRDGTVIFFESGADREPRGSFALHNCLVRDVETGQIFPKECDNQPGVTPALTEHGYFKGRTHLFEVFTSEGMMFRNHSRLFLQADSEVEKREWIDVLGKSITWVRSEQELTSQTETEENINPNCAPPPPPRRHGALSKSETEKVNAPPRPSKPNTLRNRTAPTIQTGTVQKAPETLPRLPDQLFAKDLTSSKSKAFASGSLAPELANDNSSDVDDDTLSTTDDLTISLIRILIHSYFVIIRKHIQDLVPKAIILMMITRLKRDLAGVLSGKVIHQGSDAVNITDLLHESEGVRKERQTKVNMVKLVKEALQFIDRDVRNELLAI